ncbi:ParB/RepB/Spo0J family partition protein [Bradyrhizobium sp.]|uniref:ParB/RepB/Spo0J family partition protein n=1 Tax=Bradyrhizobium sp. TaxID=376 RepID=UPI0039E456F3
MTKKKPEIESGTEITVPLNKLKASPRNVRKTPRAAADIEALAASIHAKGMLQNLVVEPEYDRALRKTGCYLVTIGEGRRLAQMLRVKRKQITSTEPVRCILDTLHDAQEISLAENVVRSAMHPADEYEAFSELHNTKGMAADDIAARFGVSPAVVRQRLKLAAVSPALIGLYRAGEMNLEQLVAFTLTDDHARQEAVWDALGWDKEADTIRGMLTENHISTKDRRARFVGVDAYVAAGGIILRDLFDDGNGGYLADAALLDRLVLQKLDQEADAVRAEGWAWVNVTAEFDHRTTADMRRLYPVRPEVSDDTQQRIDTLAAEYNTLIDQVEDSDDGGDAARRLATLEAAMEELEGQPVFVQAAIAIGGAFVSLGYDGSVRIERGYIRKSDEPRVLREDDDAQPAAQANNALSEKLVAELTAYRTAALREAVATNADVAFLTVVHVFAVQTFYHAERMSCLDINLRSSSLSSSAPGIDETALGQAAMERQTNWSTRLPEDVNMLWDTLAAFSRDRLMELLAHCAALTIDCVVTRNGSPHALAHAGLLAKAVSLDMSRYWQPTANNYFLRVTKPLIIEAVREAVSDQAALRLADLKKSAMAEAAERAVAETNWLPELLRAPSDPFGSCAG